MYSKQTHTHIPIKETKKLWSRSTEANHGQDQQKQTRFTVKESVLMIIWLQERQVSFKIRKFYP